MKVTSFNKKGEEIKTKDTIITNENIYKIIKKHIQESTNRKEVVKA